MVAKKSIAAVLLIPAVLIILAASASAAGIRPASVTLSYEPGMARYVNIEITNYNGKEIMVEARAEGDLSGYISFPENRVEIGPDEKTRPFSYRVVIPYGAEFPGEMRGSVIFRIMHESPEGRTVAGSGVEIESNVKVVFPYPRVYAEAYISIPEMEAEAESEITATIRNMGLEEIGQGLAELRITDPSGNPIESLERQVPGLQPSEARVVVFAWAPALNGSYTANLTFYYGNRSASASGRFEAGKPGIRLAAITAGSYSLGEIARIELLLESMWNEELEGVYAELQLYSKDELIGSQKSASAKISAYSSITLPAYIETAGISEGDYRLRILIHHPGGTEESFWSIGIHENRISVNEMAPETAEAGMKWPIGKDMAVIAASALIIAMLAASLISNLRRRQAVRRERETEKAGKERKKAGRKPKR